MQPRELFGVGVRLIGLVTVLLGLPSILSFNFGGMLQAAGQIVVGLILITRADQLTDLCYPARDSDSNRRQDDRDR